EADIPHFLSGLQLRHSSGFDDWADEKRHTLLQRYAGVLAAAVREAMASNRSRDAARAAERWVALDGFSADAALALMESHFLANNRGAALQALADHRSRLTD